MVLPPVNTQTVTNSPISQALNTTINVINTATVTVTGLITTNPSGGGNGGKDDKSDDKKQDDKKDPASTDKVSVKNDDAAKKMYCN